MIFVQEPAGGGRFNHPAPFNSIDELKQYMATAGIPDSYLPQMTYFDPSSGEQGSMDKLMSQPAAQPAPTQTPLPAQPPLQGGPAIDPNSPLSTPDAPVNQASVPNTDISPYIPATSNQQQDIIKQAIAQSQGVGQQNVQSLQDILNPYVTSQVKNWTDPNSPDYQATMGNLNNFGRADSNTFGQSLASRLAPLIAENQMKLGTNALQPSFTTQQGLVTSGANTQSNLGLASLQRFIDQQNFDKQAALANQLADKGQPSNFQQGVGGASSLLNGVGNFLQGIPGLKSIASGCFISTACTGMMGLPDNCDDLTILRYFRDNFVDPEEVKTYYEIAPKIVKELNLRTDRMEVYKTIYNSMVKPCVRLILGGYNQKAFKLYKSKVQGLLH